MKLLLTRISALPLWTLRLSIISNHTLDNNTALRRTPSAALAPLYHATIPISANHHVSLTTVKSATPPDLLAFGRNRIQPSYVSCGAPLCAHCGHGSCDRSMHCCFLLVLLCDFGGSCWAGRSQRRQRDPFGRKKLVGSVALTGTSVIERARKNITIAEFDCATIVMVWLCSIATARTTFDSGMERRKWILDLERHGIPTGKSQFLDGIHTGVFNIVTLALAWTRFGDQDSDERDCCTRSAKVQCA